MSVVDDVVNAGRDLPALLSRREAARWLGVCPHTVSRWIRSGRLHAIKTHPGQQGRVRIPRESVLRMLTEGAA